MKPLHSDVHEKIRTGSIGNQSPSIYQGVLILYQQGHRVFMINSNLGHFDLSQLAPIYWSRSIRPFVISHLYPACQLYWRYLALRIVAPFRMKSVSSRTVREVKLVRKTRIFKYIENLPPKTEVISDENF